MLQDTNIEENSNHEITQKFSDTEDDIHDENAGVETGIKRKVDHDPEEVITAQKLIRLLNRDERKERMIGFLFSNFLIF